MIWVCLEAYGLSVSPCHVLWHFVHICKICAFWEKCNCFFVQICKQSCTQGWQLFCTSTPAFALCTHMLLHSVHIMLLHCVYMPLHIVCTCICDTLKFVHMSTQCVHMPLHKMFPIFIFKFLLLYKLNTASNVWHQKIQHWAQKTSLQQIYL